MEYDTTGPDDLIWGTGTGCGGRVQILVAFVADSLLQNVVSLLRSGQAAMLTTVIKAGPDLGRRTLGAPEGAAAEDGAVFCQQVSPPTTLLICGAGEDSRPEARLAVAVGCRVIVVDHRPAWAVPERFPGAAQVVVCEPSDLGREVEVWPGSYAVVLSHGYDRDKEYLKALLTQPLAYVGLLGSRLRSRQLITELLAEAPDLAAAVSERLRAPVGLDIGADGPEEIAAAVVAEVIAHRSQRPGGPLAAAWGPGPGAA